MTISISSIAWNTAIEPEVFKVLRAHNIMHLDIAPSQYFHNIEETTDSEVLKVKDYFFQNGFTLVGMQSLLYGTSGFNVFAEATVQNKMLAYLQKVAHIASLLGATKLVFGSPRNRDCAVVAQDQVTEIAQKFFYRLGDIAAQERVTFCLEANPTCYGTNFLTTTSETFEFVKTLDHPQIKLQLDIGTVLTNKEPFTLIDQVSDYIGHIHISQPQLQAINRTYPHGELSPFLSLLPLIKTIEMTTGSEPIENITRSLAVVQEYYGN